MIGRARWEGTSGFELSLEPSGKDPGRFTIRSIGEISRRSALETLRTFGLVPGLVNVIPGCRPAREGQGGPGNMADRVEVVRLSLRQTLCMFDAILSRDSKVRELYADLEAKGFSPIPGRVRGTVMRSYSADGRARAGGLVVELGHERPDGALARFRLSARERRSGGAIPDEVRADYTVRSGRRVETCTGGERARGGSGARCRRKWEAL